MSGPKSDSFNRPSSCLKQYENDEIFSMIGRRCTVSCFSTGPEVYMRLTVCSCKLNRLNPRCFAQTWLCIASHLVLSDFSYIRSSALRCSTWFSKQMEKEINRSHLLCEGQWKAFVLPPHVQPCGMLAALDEIRTKYFIVIFCNRSAEWPFDFDLLFTFALDKDSGVGARVVQSV